MKKEKILLEEGDVIVSRRNNFRRMIRSIIEPAPGSFESVVCSYYNELFDAAYRPTGKFNPYDIHFCSRAHLLSWGIKEPNVKGQLSEEKSFPGPEISMNEFIDMVANDLPEWKRACDIDEAGIVVLYQDAFGESVKELILMASAIKYGLHKGKVIRILPKYPKEGKYPDDSI